MWSPTHEMALGAGGCSGTLRGSGLGLALVRAIVARHGGQASIRSRANQGTQVTLRLPVEGG